MRLEHTAIWTQDIERLKDFYIRFFNATPNQKYHANKGECGEFESYFLSFDYGARLEIMQQGNVQARMGETGREVSGLTHLAFAISSREELHTLLARLQDAGHVVMSGPRTTGDGYYEACILDPDGNRVELVVNR